MPQMSPLNWLNLYLIFMSIYLINQIIMYYMYMNSPTNKLNNNKHINTTMKWKW